MSSVQNGAILYSRVNLQPGSVEAEEVEEEEKEASWAAALPVSVSLHNLSGGGGFVLPVDLAVLVQVLQALQHVFEDGGDGGLVQDAGLVLPPRDDVLDDVQHGAWNTTVDKGDKKKRSSLLFFPPPHFLLFCEKSRSLSGGWGSSAAAGSKSIWTVSADNLLPATSRWAVSVLFQTQFLKTRTSCALASNQSESIYFLLSVLSDLVRIHQIVDRENTPPTPVQFHQDGFY